MFLGASVDLLSVVDTICVWSDILMQSAGNNYLLENFYDISFTRFATESEAVVDYNYIRNVTAGATINMLSCEVYGLRHGSVTNTHPVYLFEQSVLNIIDSEIYDWTAANTVIYTVNAYLTIKDSFIYNNVSTVNALIKSTSEVVLENTMFINNTTADSLLAINGNKFYTKGTNIFQENEVTGQKNFIGLSAAKMYLEGNVMIASNSIAAANANMISISDSLFESKGNLIIYGNEIGADMFKTAKSTIESELYLHGNTNIFNNTVDNRIFNMNGTIGEFYNLHIHDNVDDSTVTEEIIYAGAASQLSYRNLKIFSHNQA